MPRLANRRSFDCASRDETTRGFAQDDTFGKVSITYNQPITHETTRCFAQDDTFCNLSITYNQPYNP
jgi:hypothetical protein